MKDIPGFASEDDEREFWEIHDSVEFLEGSEQVDLEYGSKDITGSNSKTILYSPLID